MAGSQRQEAHLLPKQRAGSQRQCAGVRRAIGQRRCLGCAQQHTSRNRCRGTGGAPARPHTAQSLFDVRRIDALPLVGLVASHGNMRAEVYDAWAAAGARAIVHAGFGGGTVPDYLQAALAGLRARGVLLVRASRTGAGPVVRNASADDDAHGWVVTDDQNAPRARLLAALALTQTQDPDEIQRIFLRY